MNACPASASSTDTTTDIEHRFRAFVAAPDYPCVGAKTALSRGNIDIIVAGDMRSNDGDRDIVRRLQHFAATAGRSPTFVSVVLIFEHTPRLSEREFEVALWERLQGIHDIDVRDYRWDERISNDPASPDFAFSVGGRGFFIIGLHPDASREARRFACPALVFNLHSQFEQLRKEHRFHRIGGIIAKRDQAFCGSVNPMLAEHGDSSDAPQYSGRQVDAGWCCPFQARPPETPHDSRDCPAQRNRV